MIALGLGLGFCVARFAVRAYVGMWELTMAILLSPPSPHAPRPSPRICASGYLLCPRPSHAPGSYTDMRRKFGQIHKEYSPQARTFYCHFTSVTVRRAPCYFSCRLVPEAGGRLSQDTKSTSEVLVNSTSLIYAHLVT